MSHGQRGERDPLQSLEALLAPAVLATLEGRPVARVRRLPFASADSLSGSRFLAVEATGVDGAVRRFVVKRIDRAWDWIMRATGDGRGRAALAWTTGLLDRLPPEVTAEVVAVARDGDGWAILLRDVGDALVPSGDEPIPAADNVAFLEAMAALHVAFWGEPEAADPARGFCSLEQRYAEFVPEVARREAGGPDPIPPLIGRGWDVLWTLLDPGLARDLQSLLGDPGPLVAGLRRDPQTIVHGDWKFGNLGLLRSGGSPRVVLLDWAVVGPAPPAVDLAWYLAVNCARLPVSKEETVDRYLAALLRRLGRVGEPDWWAPSLDLALLGGLLQLGWAKGVGAVDGPTADVRARERAEIDWWAARAAAGLRRLDQ